jgi:hypothetical protein
MTRLAAVLVVLASLPPGAARADDACSAFTWDVHHERELFSQGALDLASGKALADAPALAPEKLYELELRAQPEVRFAAPPGHVWPKEATYAGLARLTVEAAGLYRIALDQGAWIDVVVKGALLPLRDSQGRTGCNAPHKIVEFSLPAGEPVTLQFSASITPSLKVTVTRAPGQ